MQKSKWEIFPNPADNTLNIRNNDLNESIEYVIYDMMGSILKEGKSKSNSHHVIRFSLTSGVYYLKIGSLQSRQINKFLVH